MRTRVLGVVALLFLVAFPTFAAGKPPAAAAKTIQLEWDGQTAEAIYSYAFKGAGAGGGPKQSPSLTLTIKKPLSPLSIVLMTHALEGTSVAHARIEVKNPKGMKILGFDLYQVSVTSYQVEVDGDDMNETVVLFAEQVSYSPGP
ncbi:MAG TPA: hypothetical protein VF701_17180 [Thermoanaerobaculia bacterium]